MLSVEGLGWEMADGGGGGGGGTKLIGWLDILTDWLTELVAVAEDVGGRPGLVVVVIMTGVNVPNVFNYKYYIYKI